MANISARKILVATYTLLTMLCINSTLLLAKPAKAQPKTNIPSPSLRQEQTQRLTPSQVIRRGIRPKRIIRQVARLEARRGQQRALMGITRYKIPHAPGKKTRKKTGSLPIKEPAFIKK